MTFYLIRNGKIEGSSELPLTSEGAICIEKKFTQEELKALELGATLDEENNVVITPEIEDKIELAEIETKLRGAKDRYTELRELGEMRSNAEETEFQALETAKNTLLARRKQLLDK
ncbi:MAG TPA: hypothetical protein PKC87_04155 [Candidatus Absconditabacterales bacterium]|nr:hypothetical protein [Candidatus Absconditabacterales bacterium]